MIMASPAQADVPGYLDRLGGVHLMIVHDSALMVAQGRGACAAMDSNNGTAVIAAFRGAPWFYDQDEAFAIVESAAVELCPWHDHRGEVVAAPAPGPDVSGVPITGGVGKRLV
jgi:hypothetical protein